MDNPVRVLKCIIEITDVSYDKGRNLKNYSKKLGCHSSRQNKKKTSQKGNCFLLFWHCDLASPVHNK